MFVFLFFYLGASRAVEKSFVLFEMCWLRKNFIKGDCDRILLGNPSVINSTNHVLILKIGFIKKKDRCRFKQWDLRPQRILFYLIKDKKNMCTQFHNNRLSSFGSFIFKFIRLLTLLCMVREISIIVFSQQKKVLKPLVL